MDDHVLVAYNGSDLARRALDRALATPRETAISVLYVIDPVVAVYDAELEGLPAASEMVEELSRRGDEITAEAAEIADSVDRSIEIATATGNPAREIVAYARANDVDHIVMGSHGRTGVSRLVLGSVAERVLRRSAVPVTVVR